MHIDIMIHYIGYISISRNIVFGYNIIQDDKNKTNKLT